MPKPEHAALGARRLGGGIEAGHLSQLPPPTTPGPLPEATGSPQERDPGGITPERGRQGLDGGRPPQGGRERRLPEPRRSTRQADQGKWGGAPEVLEGVGPGDPTTPVPDIPQAQVPSPGAPTPGIPPMHRGILCYPRFPRDPGLHQCTRHPGRGPRPTTPTGTPLRKHEGRTSREDPPTPRTPEHHDWPPWASPR